MTRKKQRTHPSVKKKTPVQKYKVWQTKCFSWLCSLRMTSLVDEHGKSISVYFLLHVYKLSLSSSHQYILSWKTLDLTSLKIWRHIFTISVCLNGEAATPETESTASQFTSTSPLAGATMEEPYTCRHAATVAIPSGSQSLATSLKVSQCFRPRPATRPFPPVRRPSPRPWSWTNASTIAQPPPQSSLSCLSPLRCSREGSPSPAMPTPAIELRENYILRCQIGYRSSDNPYTTAAWVQCMWVVIPYVHSDFPALGSWMSISELLDSMMASSHIVENFRCNIVVSIQKANWYHYLHFLVFKSECTKYFLCLVYHCNG